MEGQKVSQDEGADSGMDHNKYSETELKLKEKMLKEKKAQIAKQWRQKMRNDPSHRQREVDRVTNYRLKKKYLNCRQSDKSEESHRLEKQPIRSIEHRNKDRQIRKRKLESQKSGDSQTSIILDILDQNIAGDRVLSKVRVIETSPSQSMTNQELSFNVELSLQPINAARGDLNAECGTYPHEQSSSLIQELMQSVEENKKLNGFAKQPKSVKQRNNDHKRRKRRLESNKFGDSQLSIIDIINRNIVNNKVISRKIRVIESSPSQNMSDKELNFDDEFFFSKSSRSQMIKECGMHIDQDAQQQVIDQALAQRFVTYTEHSRCSEPELRKLLNRNVPSLPRGNCLFYCFIMTYNLNMGSIQLRRILLGSPHLHDCGNPEEARQILSSDKEFGDADVIFIFSRHYQCNVCVHWHLQGRILYLQTKYDENPQFIHLRLQGNHFEPYMPTPRRAHNPVRQR
ncbi:hypothetical protein QAD02_000016 [Eretmocerus hayati]|uniref:Uncharacterized protein n=1 Tax=Eretmocerus hayati TaxID=131215 RepID=A0ACC2NES4_9HYME|nr:hypothetical protein QAD02_000016 [Eretmocerus hayati]